MNSQLFKIKHNFAFQNNIIEYNSITVIFIVCKNIIYDRMTTTTNTFVLAITIRKNVTFSYFDHSMIILSEISYTRASTIKHHINAE